MRTELAIGGQRVLMPSGLGPASIHISDGRIVALGEYGHMPANVPSRDFGDALIMPGVVDTHVHINEPGRTEWEGFRTATRAAAAGGYTTLVDMPLNCLPETTTVAALEEKRGAAKGKT